MDRRSSISGNTRVFGVLADPIGQVKAPGAINELFARNEDDCVLVPLHVTAEELASVVAGLRSMQNLGGFVVTVPHKTAATECCDTLSEAACLVGAVNVVTRDAQGLLHGHNLDGLGFIAGLRQADIDPDGMSVFLAGAGGAANAIAFALAASGVRSLTLFNRTPAKARHLRTRLIEAYPAMTVLLGSDDPAEHELVINATSLGLRPDDPLPLDVTRLEPGQIVAEIIMDPADTALLRAARQRGCRAHPGVAMLDGQVQMIYQTLREG